jgi:hypothetical protein
MIASKNSIWSGTCKVFQKSFFLDCFPPKMLLSGLTCGCGQVGIPGVPKYPWMPTLLAQVRSIRVLAGLIYSYLPPDMGFAMVKSNSEPQGLVLKVSAKVSMNHLFTT